MKKYYFLIVSLFVTAYSFGQVDFQRVVPQNPNVSALFKSTITPVTEYSGSAGVTIPLYTLSEGGISVPISISYATGGIQVGEESSVVGLGWSLNAGGAITRTVSGIDDFDPKGFLNNLKDQPDFPVSLDNKTMMAEFWNSNPFLDSSNPPGSNQEFDCTFTSNGQTQYYDLPPRAPEIKDNDYLRDTFMYNFNGRGGSFVLTKEDEFAFLMSKKPIKIWYEGTGAGTSSSVTFKILTEDGSKFSFNQKALTYLPNGNMDDFVSAWYLTEISDIYGNQAIFGYNSDNSYFPFRSFNQGVSATTGQSESVSSYTTEMVGPVTEVDDILLTSIEMRKNGVKVQEAVFEYSNPPINGTFGERKDLVSSFLKSVKIYNAIDANPIENFTFYQSYFGLEDSYQIQNIDLTAGDFGGTIARSTDPHINLRLRLDGIVKNNIEEHTFEYHGCEYVPNKTSMSQDYWGFYNGVNNADVFVPEISSWQADQAYVPQQKWANRLPNEEHSKMFSLKSVKYPTGGTTEYEYEINTFDQSFNPMPAPTTLKPYFASAPGIGDTQVITPNQNRTLRVRFNVALTGWNTSMSASLPQAPVFGTDFFVQLEKMDGTVVTRITLDSYAQDYYTLTSDYSNPLVREEVFDFSYDTNTAPNLKLDEAQYRLRAVFNTRGGLFYGQAHISTEILESDVSETEQYSIGGGLRISKIVNKDTNGLPVTQQSFNYHYQELNEDNLPITKSFGKLKTVPDFALDKRIVWFLSIWLSDGGDYGAMPLMVGAAGSQTPWSRDMGSFVGYSKVENYNLDKNNVGDNGKVVKTFVNQVDKFRTTGALLYADDYHSFPPIRVPHNGLPILEETYNSSGTLLRSVQNKYRINDVDTDANNYNLGNQFWHEDFILSAAKELPIDNIGSAWSTYYFCDGMQFQLYPHYSNEVQQVGVIEKVYDKNGGNEISTVQEFKYENRTHLQRTESKLTNSKGEEVITKTYYADDILALNSLGNPALSTTQKQLLDDFKSDGALHRIGEPIQTETTVNGEKTVQRTFYKDWGSNSTKVWPEFVKTLKGDYNATTNPLENRLNYHLYDDFGNPLMVSKEEGIKISYIWGYNKKYPVAKVENASNTDIENILGTGLDLGIGGLTNAQENILRSGLPDAMITTYTYDPLVGVTSVTDPRDYTITYIYDSFNRLKEVRDKDNHLVTDYEYHYTGQGQ